MSKAVILSVFMFALIGCTTTTKPKIHPEKNVYADVIWPEVSLFYKEPSEELRNRCIEFHNASVLQQCDMSFLKLNYELEQFKNSNYFADVTFADSNSDYVIAFTQAKFLKEDAGDIAKGALAGATLMLVPITQDQDVVVEVAIMWRGIIIREMAYEFAYTPTLSLYTNPEQSKIELAGEIAAKVIEDIKREDVLSGQYMASVLDATDYTKDLVVPERAGEYFRTPETLLGSPLEGAAISYTRPEFLFDEYVVSIYPIRATSWIDYTSVLSAELNLIHDDFATAQSAGEWRSVRFGDQQELLVKAASGGNVGVVQSVDLVDMNGDQFIGQIYLFVKEDKIICLSNFVPVTYAQPSPQVFLSNFFDGLQMPGESAFMAKIRQQ